MRTQLGLFTVLIGAYALAATPACSSGSGPTSPLLSGWYETTDPTSAITAIGFVDSSHYVMWKTCQAAYETCGSSGTYDFEDNDTTMSMTDDVNGETTRMKFMTLSPPSATSTASEHLEDEPTSGALTPGSSQSLTGGSSPWGIGVDGVPFLGPSALTTDSQTDLVDDSHTAGAGAYNPPPPQGLRPFVCPPSTVLPANAVEGIDISHYQLCPFSNGHCSGGNAHFDQVAQVAKFVIFKATEGNSQLDPTFQTDFKAAKDQTGGTLIRGAYHFLRARSPAPQSKVLTGAEQAQWFYNNVTMAGGLDATDLPPVMDAEALALLNSGVLPKDFIPVIKDFVATAESLFKRRIMVYTGPYFWGGTLTTQLPTNDHPPQIGNPMGIPGIDSQSPPEAPFWVADYWLNKSCPRMPVPGTSNPTPWASWSFWQHLQSVPRSKYNLPNQTDGRGAELTVDEDLFFGDLPALQAMIQSTNHL